MGRPGHTDPDLSDDQAALILWAIAPGGTRMQITHRLEQRRRFLRTLAVGAAGLYTTRGVFAEQLTETAPSTEGPFYPDTMPLDTDNDLLIINDAITPAVGPVVYLGGRVMSASGQPVRNAFVEIWQVDSTGSYIHKNGRAKGGGEDRNFQGYGRFLTDAKGQYFFRTVKPVAYDIGAFRAPHIHVAISQNGRRVFTTQMVTKGDPSIPRDLVFARMSSAALETITRAYVPLPGSTLGELTASFDIVLGRTAEEVEDGFSGGVGKPQWNPQEFRR
jgi:protocatechuate 3,4-dioxygenase beta subunit